MDTRRQPRAVYRKRPAAAPPKRAVDAEVVQARKWLAEETKELEAVFRPVQEDEEVIRAGLHGHPQEEVVVKRLFETHAATLAHLARNSRLRRIRSQRRLELSRDEIEHEARPPEEEESHRLVDVARRVLSQLGNTVPCKPNLFRPEEYPDLRPEEALARARDRAQDALRLHTAGRPSSARLLRSGPVHNKRGRPHPTPRSRTVPENSMGNERVLPRRKPKPVRAAGMATLGEEAEEEDEEQTPTHRRPRPPSSLLPRPAPSSSSPRPALPFRRAAWRDASKPPTMESVERPLNTARPVAQYARRAQTPSLRSGRRLA